MSERSWNFPHGLPPLDTYPCQIITTRIIQGQFRRDFILIIGGQRDIFTAFPLLVPATNLPGFLMRLSTFEGFEDVDADEENGLEGCGGA